MTILVVHGPLAFDMGDVTFLNHRLRPTQVVVCGVMGRTAAEESGIAFCHDARPPSRVLHDLGDDAVLVNRGKNSDSGRWFGNLVASRLMGRGLIQFECSDRTLRLWDLPRTPRMDAMAELTAFERIEDHAIPPPERGTREMKGCLPGEAVFVNGCVIGRATTGTVLLACQEGRILPVSGVAVKQHGLEKLHARGPVDLARAWCKTGTIRTGIPGCGPQKTRRGPGDLLLIDHCGHLIYERITPGTCGILAVGDDTTHACGHIGYHLSLPVIGITDGDGDGIVDSVFARGSVMVTPVTGRDDEFGIEAAGLMDGQMRTFEGWKTRIIDHFGDRVRVTPL